MKRLALLLAVVMLPAAGSGAASDPRAGLYLCAEPVVLAKILDVRIRGAGFVPIPQIATETPTPPPGTPGPYEVLSHIPLGKEDAESEMAPVYDAHLRVAVVSVLEDGGLVKGLLRSGDELAIVHEGLPRQPDYHPQNLVRLRLRLHCDRRDPLKASYKLWQLVEASPPLSPEAAATFTQPFHLHRAEGDYDREVAIVKEFIKTVSTWPTYDGLAVPGMGTLRARESGGTFLCLTGHEPVRRGTLELAGDTVTTQELHDFAFHDKESLRPETVEKLYLVWKQLRATGAIDER